MFTKAKSDTMTIFFSKAAITASLKIFLLLHQGSTVLSASKKRLLML